MSLDKIFSRCIEEGDCLIWQDSVNSCGQPMVSVGGKSVAARGLVFEAAGKPLRKGHKITTSCDCRRCLKPEHVVQMTAAAIVKRACKKRGIAHRMRLAAAARPKSKLNGQTDDVLRRIHEGESQSAIALDLGVSKGAIWRLATGRSFRSYGNHFPGVV